MEKPSLTVVMYHHVRDSRTNRFPRLNCLDLDRFRKQVSELADGYEMASLESALAFLAGTYEPRRNLCLLTFDDGLREHYEEVTPILAEARMQGLFFVITGCQEHRRVAPVHMNHFLAACLGSDPYRELFLRRLGRQQQPAVNPVIAAHTYPWDTPSVAAFKYLFNFALPVNVRDQVVRDLFVQHLGSEEVFSRELYFSWHEGQQMQREGMILGGHTSAHSPLSNLEDQALKEDLQTCRELLEKRLERQALWPFCYPYGKRESYDDRSVSLLRGLGFCCSFSTESGNNRCGADIFAIRRVDCNRAGTSDAKSAAMAASEGKRL